MATVTVVARYESVTATNLAYAWLNRRQLLYELFQLSDLVKLLNLLRSTDVPTTDENARQLRRLRLALVLSAAEDPFQLGWEWRVHWEISFVDSHGKAMEDRCDGSAVFERRSHHAEACEVDDDAVLRARDRNPYIRFGFRLPRIWFRISPEISRLGICAEELIRGTSWPGSEDQIRCADSVENSRNVFGRRRWRRRRRRREGRGIVGAEVLDVFEREGGGGGRVCVVNLNRRFTPRPPHWRCRNGGEAEILGTKLGFLWNWICREMVFGGERERRLVKKKVVGRFWNC